VSQRWITGWKLASQDRERLLAGSSAIMPRAAGGTSSSITWLPDRNADRRARESHGMTERRLWDTA
jgi:hypothetical protein